ncbi:MAG: thioredoxin [Ignavibacteria bacterium]|nr:thioredoxin [Ignavibacteria bacterium]
MKNKKIYILTAGLTVLVGILLVFAYTSDSQTTENKYQITEQTVKPDNKGTKTEKGKNMEYLTAQTFKEKVFNYETNKEWKYEGEVPCIIDFYADWCGPCKMIAPVLEELAEEYDGKIMIYKVDTEKEQELASVFGIRSIPSLLFVPKDGQPQMAVGALTKEGFVQAINEVLLKSQN